MPNSKGFKHNLTRKHAKKLKHKQTLKLKKKCLNKKKIYNRKKGGSDSSNDTQTSLLQQALEKDLLISDSSSANQSDNNNSKSRKKRNSQSNFIIIPDSQGYVLSKKNRNALGRKYKTINPITQENKESELVRVYEGNTEKEARTNAIKGLRKKPSSKKDKKKSLKPIYKPEKSDIWDESDLRDPFNLDNHPAHSYFGSKLYVDGRKN
tara:strand:+ start:2176 stop:2799 length:624 start_codon:yes stop_codon:yes gene_type:complete